jgi:hypothetical protein
VIILQRLLEFFRQPICFACGEPIAPDDDVVLLEGEYCHRQCVRVLQRTGYALQEVMRT